MSRKCFCILESTLAICQVVSLIVIRYFPSILEVLLYSRPSYKIQKKCIWCLFSPYFATPTKTFKHSLNTAGDLKMCSSADKSYEIHLLLYPVYQASRLMSSGCCLHKGASLRSNVQAPDEE